VTATDVSSRDWDAAAYDRIADPQHRWGLEVLERLRLRGDERVLDAGCGSGRVTEALAERLPDGHVIALDASSAMLAEASRRLARFGDRVELVHADLLEPLPIDPVDAILSTATFHWVPDHDALFANLADALRPGGQLVAQCGGAGNVARVEALIAELFPDVKGTHRFETPEATAERLARSGFEGIRTWSSEEPTRFEPGEPFETFLATVCLRRPLASVASDERARLMREFAERLGEPVLDYVRLNIVARRALSVGPTLDGHDAAIPLRPPPTIT
jgi:trans-aconitate 2-methyltransferase